MVAVREGFEGQVAAFQSVWIGREREGNYLEREREWQGESEGEVKRKR